MRTDNCMQLHARLHKIQGQEQVEVACHIYFSLAEFLCTHTLSFTKFRKAK